MRKYINFEDTYSSNIQNIVKCDIFMCYYLFRPTKKFKIIKRIKYDNIIETFNNIINNLSIINRIDLIMSFYKLYDDKIDDSIKHIVKYCIFHKNWEFFKHYMNHKNTDYFLIIVKYLSPYLITLPYNILKEIMEKYRYIEGNKFYYIKTSYYISSKLKNTEFIDFEEFDILYVNKLKYTILLLNSGNYIK